MGQGGQVTREAASAEPVSRATPPGRAWHYICHRRDQAEGWRRGVERGCSRSRSM